jgi:phage shock protein E
MRVRTWRRTLVALLAVSATVVLGACSESDGTTSDADAGETWTRIDPPTLQHMLDSDGITLVNVHTPYEGEIPGTDAFIAYTDISAHLDELPSDPTKLVLYCRSGNMSSMAAQDLVDAGVTGFFELEGGYEAWIAAGYPFETGADGA